MYEDANQLFKYEPTVQPVIANQVTVVDMPADSLPCPRELVQNREDSLMLSSKDESYWLPSSSFKVLSNLALVLTLVMINVLH